MCELFSKYAVLLGTSLDGPEPINDAQRGDGYFKRTMAGIDRARDHGISVGCICTFTAKSVQYADEVFDFFVSKGLNFSIHPALPSINLHFRKGNNVQNRELVLLPEAYGRLLMDMMKRYLDNLDKVQISTIDAMCRAMSVRHGSICIFSNCLGKYFAIDPEGWIYPCQRFAGIPEFRIRNVYD